MTAPNYTIVPFSVDAADERTIQQNAGMLVFLRAVDGAGAQDLDAEIQVALGRASNDFIPLTPGQKIIAETEFWRLKWAAQSGLTAKVLLSNDPDNLDVDAQPSKQLVTAANLGTTLTVTAVSVGLAATLLKAANTSRRAVTFQNLGTDVVYIGPVGVTVASGVRLAAGGGNYTSETVTAAFYGISPTAGQDVRVIEETA